MKLPVPTSLLLVVCLTLALPGRDALAQSIVPSNDVNVVIRWNQTLLQAIRETRMPPPQVARAFAIVHTAMYDARAAYDRRAVGTRRAATLRWSTFSEAADQAGLSRRLGGIHFRSGDLGGREMGERIGKQAWVQATRYFNGMKKPRRSSTDD